MKRRCGVCGNPRKTIRAVIVRQDTKPRLGLVCRLCATCGVLVVPAGLSVLPDKPRRVPRSSLLEGVERHAANIAIEPKGKR